DAARESRRLDRHRGGHASGVDARIQVLSAQQRNRPVDDPARLRDEQQGNLDPWGDRNISRTDLGPPGWQRSALRNGRHDRHTDDFALTSAGDSTDQQRATARADGYAADVDGPGEGRLRRTNPISVLSIRAVERLDDRAAVLPLADVLVDTGMEREWPVGTAGVGQA